MKEVRVSTAQKGTTIALSVGDAIVLHLRENASTGHRWTFTSLDLTRLALDDEVFRASEGGLGSGGLMQWRLIARAPGRVHVALSRRRSWEGERSSVETFAFDVEISAD